MSTGESEEHKAMVRALMKYLNEQGFQTVCAAIEGFPQCNPIRERIPDFEGKNSQGQWAIGEAKTCDDLVNDKERTCDQFRSFSSMQATFYPAVPKACFDQLTQILKELGLYGRADVNALQYG